MNHSELISRHSFDGGGITFESLNLSHQRFDFASKFIVLLFHFLEFTFEQTKPGESAFIQQAQRYCDDRHHQETEWQKPRGITLPARELHRDGFVFDF